MKNGKLPTRNEKIILSSHGLNPDDWLIVKEFPKELEIVSRSELRKIGTSKPKTRIIAKTA